MSTLRLIRAEEPTEARENVELRQMLSRLTLGTHDRQKGFVLLPSEAQAFFEVLAHRTFSQVQLDQVEGVVQEIDPHEIDSEWDDHRLESFVQAQRQRVDRPEWINLPIQRLHSAMRSQGTEARFRLWFSRAVLVAFLTADFLSTDPEELARLAG